MKEKTKWNDYDALPLILDVMDIQHIMGISRASAYELVHTPGFPAVRSGRLIKISKKAFFNWLDSGGTPHENEKKGRRNHEFEYSRKKILYAFACPNHHNTVTRLKWLTALTVDPKAKRWMLGLARKMENEVEEHWYPCFYQQLRMEMAKYYEAKKYLRMVEKSTDFEEDFYDEAV